MLLIGFSWVIFSTLASIVIRLVLPGRWEDHGPTVMMVVGTAMSLTGMTAVALTEGAGAHMYGPADLNGSALGLIASLLGGLAGFVLYVGDVKRRKPAQ